MCGHESVRPCSPSAARPLIGRLRPFGEELHWQQKGGKNLTAQKYCVVTDAQGSLQNFLNVCYAQRWDRFKRDSIPGKHEVLISFLVF